MLLHAVEDAAHQSFDNIAMVLGEVGPGEPHVGNQLVGGLRCDQQMIAFHIGKIIDVRRPGYRSRDILLDFKCSCGFKGRVGEDHFHFRRLNTAGNQHVQGKILGRRVLGHHDFLAAKIGHGFDIIANDDSVAAVGPVDLLVDSRLDSAVARS